MDFNRQVRRYEPESRVIMELKLNDGDYGGDVGKTAMSTEGLAPSLLCCGFTGQWWERALWMYPEASKQAGRELQRGGVRFKIRGFRRITSSLDIVMM